MRSASVDTIEMINVIDLVNMVDMVNRVDKVNIAKVSSHEFKMVTGQHGQHLGGRK